MREKEQDVLLLQESFDAGNARPIQALFARAVFVCGRSGRHEAVFDFLML